jgi:multicomponent Na+:H+ antiporter subunit E
MGPRTLLFIVGFSVWLLLAWPPDGQDVLVSLFVSFVVSSITGDLFVRMPQPHKNFSRYLWFLYYVPLFIWECIKANIDVAYRVSHPDVLIKPGIVKIKTNLKSDAGLTFLANSITLTPGTMSVDIDKANGVIYIHWIYVAEKDMAPATKAIAEKFENVLRRIFE